MGIRSEIGKFVGRLLQREEAVPRPDALYWTIASFCTNPKYKRFADNHPVDGEFFGGDIVKRVLFQRGYPIQLPKELLEIVVPYNGLDARGKFAFTPLVKRALHNGNMDARVVYNPLQETGRVYLRFWGIYDGINSYMEDVFVTDRQTVSVQTRNYTNADGLEIGRRVVVEQGDKAPVSRVIKSSIGDTIEKAANAAMRVVLQEADRQRR